jgi:polysaccharide biosynthesis/export protein
MLIWVAFSATSCLSYKEIVNFQDGALLGGGAGQPISNHEQLKIKSDDVVLITIYSYNAEEAERFNTISAQQLALVLGQGGGNSVSEPLGYQVDSHGEIEMPVIGKFNVAGLTTEELREVVRQKVTATGYLKDLTVQVRFLSFRVTILGEVNAPGTFTVSSKKITILEALGLARDLTMFSNRDNILIIREKEGERFYGRANLKSKNIFENPYYYLQPNDIVYVEPHKSKILSAPDPASRYLSIILSLATLATVLFAL